MCKFSENFQMFDITPVENLFIHEFMLKAPGDFVKVYLYGLMQCYHPNSSENALESFSHSLGMDVDTIQNAFKYWERQGILYYQQDGDGQLSIEYYNIKDVLYNKGLNSEKTMYKYKDFNQNLQHMFDTRLLTPQEYLRIYDWIEVLNLPMEVVLMMIQFYISRMGKKVRINYLDKVAASWARDGINTLQKAEEYIRANDACFKDTIAVLKYLGIHRSPSKAELDLYKKWQGWGFNLNSILLACKETTKVQQPTFAYLDRILANMYKKGAITPQEVRAHLDKQDDVHTRLKELYYELGHKDNKPTPEHLSMYRNWTVNCSLDHEVILLACKQCVRNQRNTFEYLDSLLNQWLKNGLTTVQDINDFLSKSKTMDNEIRAVLQRAGESRSINLSDRKLYQKWTESWNMSFEVILLAAEYSVMAKEKISYINKILSDWHNKGINTVSEGKADHERHKMAKELMEQQPDKGLKKKLDFNKFPQHNYTEEDLENLFENIGE
jgi:DnaD/phage-associated family protein